MSKTKFTNAIMADITARSRLKAVVDECAMITDYEVTKTFESQEMNQPVKCRYVIEIEGWTTEEQLPEQETP